MELLLAIYYLFDVELGQSEDFAFIDLIELPSVIFVVFILFKDFRPVAREEKPHSHS